MADDKTPEGQQPIPPQKRRILQQLFEKGSKESKLGNFDYANDMFKRCITEDPGNQIYAQNFLFNLQRKYNNNKKGSKLAMISGAGAKTLVKKAYMQKNWKQVIASGVDFLAYNPWDNSTLTSMAAACAALGHDETELVYYRAALEADMKDAETNRLAARALGRQGKFDDAIRCWHRVQQAVKGDEEAARAIGDLTIEKTIRHGGYEDAESSKEVRADKDDAPAAGIEITPERQLEKAIAKKPEDVSNYLQLADLHIHKERYEQAAEMLQKAFEVSGGDVNIRERIEDLQLRRHRDQLAIALKKAQSERTKEAVELYNGIKTELNRVELDVYRSRSERNPQHYGYMIELGLRMQRAGLYKEAIPTFQKAQQDPRRRGEVLLSLGECFQNIKQYKLAMNNYEGAVEAVPGADVDRKKLALYRAGVMAMDGLKDYSKAEKYLSELAGLDFGYKDVGDRLEKLEKLKEEAGDGPATL